MQKLYESIMRNDVTVRRWRSTGALIIDESEHLYDSLQRGRPLMSSLNDRRRSV